METGAGRLSAREIRVASRVCEKAMAAIKGMKWTSPRGPVEIDPQTRDINQTVYVRKVEKANGKLANVEFDKIPDVKDPGK